MKYNNPQQRKARRKDSTPVFIKEQYMQAAFKFVVRPARSSEDAYLQYLADPSYLVEWQDVCEVIYTPPNVKSPQKIVCPICLEPANQIIAPRVTKCGHIFCWPCLLQYLQFERQYAWKKCPLCSESIYKKDIRRVKILEPATDELEF